MYTRMLISFLVIIVAFVLFLLNKKNVIEKKKPKYLNIAMAVTFIPIYYHEYCAFD